MAKQRKRANVEQPEPAEVAPEPAADTDESGDVGKQSTTPPRRQSPVWMVPTDDGMVPESEVRHR